ncbi:MerR family transcriptional regulator [Paraurantiacibacter namhicola]|uniref:Mercuric resistance operon regulatory protein n=1 Tax=Paraurantiacibacter namhicola TaxID=645517 RepID=A0A1C7D8B1_9SPHN|nr:MerR family DNA-binding transcriptional regulator [Paraurantiacibacter namhicola]ANU07714.1 Mercuric resistance operon regulatory protein [Paraurantiacibacter namhicola]
MTAQQSSEQSADGDLKSIAEVAEALGITQRTLRFYEDKGLIQPTRVGSMRVYSRREMGRMQLILRGKQLGFSIREIGEFLELYDGDRNHARQTRTLLDRVRQRLADLSHQREAIDETIAELKKIEDEAQEHLTKLER